MKTQDLMLSFLATAFVGLDAYRVRIRKGLKILGGWIFNVLFLVFLLALYFNIGWFLNARVEGGFIVLRIMEIGVSEAVFSFLWVVAWPLMAVVNIGSLVVLILYLLLYPLLHYPFWLIFGGGLFKLLGLI